MARPDAVRRVKSYSAATGYVYQYYFYEVQKLRRGLLSGTEYVYMVSVDRFAFFLMSLSTICIALAPLLLVASCTSLQQTPQELQARETLRTMTRGGVLPAEDAVARIEKDFPKTTAGALAKIIHARIKLNAKDYAGAASLLDDSSVRNYTVIGDYALWMKASTLEQANRRVEARAAHEKLARDYPYSLRARDAMLHNAQMLMQDG